MEWQPIETAPKDGTLVLLHAPQSGNWNGTHVALWDWDEPSGSYGHKWRTADYQNLGRAVWGYPSHWMPLPAPPHQ